MSTFSFNSPNSSSFSNSSFSFAKNNSKNPTDCLRITLNISKKASFKETILGYTHNGVIFINSSDNSAFLKMRMVSDKQGSVPMSAFDFMGTEANINAEHFLTKFYKATHFNETVDTHFIVDLGDASSLEEEFFNSGSLQLDIPTSSFEIHSESEFKGSSYLSFKLKNVTYNFCKETVGRQIVDADWIRQCLTASVIPTKIDGNTLSNYRRVSNQPAIQMAKQSISNSTPTSQSDVDVNEFDALEIIEEGEITAFDLSSFGVVSTSQSDSQSEVIEESEVTTFNLSSFGISSTKPQDWVDEEEEDYEEDFEPEIEVNTKAKIELETNLDILMGDTSKQSSSTQTANLDINALFNKLNL